MNVKDLEKASKLMEQIKALDAEIIKVEKFAVQLANHNHKAEIIFKAENLDDQAKQKVCFDEDGSLMTPGAEHRSRFDMFSSMINGGPRHYSFRCDQSVGTTVLNAQVTETDMLQMLGLLLHIRQEQRRDLIGELKRMGLVL